MPLDTSIALQARGPQLESPLETQAKVMTLKQLAGQQEMQQMQLDQARQSTARQQQLRSLISGLPAETTDDQRIDALRRGGYFEEADKLQSGILTRDKTRAEIGKQTADTKKTEFDVLKNRLDAANSVVSSVLASTPNPTHQDVYSAIAQAAQQYGLSAQEQTGLARGLPGDPTQLRGWLIGKGTEILNAKDRIEMLMPKREKVDNGGQISFVDVNPLTNPQGPGAVKKVATPGETLSAATQRRGQDLTDARARETNAVTREANATVYDPERGVLVNKATGGVREPTTADGRPLGPRNKDLTDAQAKALLFGSRMQQAEKQLQALNAKGVDMPSIIKMGADNVPLVGGALGAAANATVASEEQQQVEQAQRDFINAVLRRESGAVIADSEFLNARKQYFPQVGDGDAVKEQKRLNRQLAMQKILEEVPAARRNTAAAPTAPGPQLNTAFDVPDDVMQIIQKHGGK